MIGLSSGSWAAVVAASPDVEKLTVVEINPGYLKLLPLYSAVAELSGHPKVSIEIDDGRRWLVRNSSRRFDAIISNTTHHWRANASNLLSVEFLQLVRSRLKPGGIFYFNTTGSARAARTVSETFSHALGVSGMIACSDARLEFDFGRWRRSLESYVVGGERQFRPGRTEDLRLLDGLEASLRAGGLVSGDKLRARGAGLAPITDDNMGSEWTE
jgi:spermidine synthase